MLNPFQKLECAWHRGTLQGPSPIIVAFTIALGFPCICTPQEHVFSQLQVYSVSLSNRLPGKTTGTQIQKQTLLVSDGKLSLFLDFGLCDLISRSLGFLSIVLCTRTLNIPISRWSTACWKRKDSMVSQRVRTGDEPKNLSS